MKTPNLKEIVLSLAIPAAVTFTSRDVEACAPKCGHVETYCEKETVMVPKRHIVCEKRQVVYQVPRIVMEQRVATIKVPHIVRECVPKTVTRAHKVWVQDSYTPCAPVCAPVYTAPVCAPVCTPCAPVCAPAHGCRTGHQFHPLKDIASKIETALGHHHHGKELYNGGCNGAAVYAPSYNGGAPSVQQFGPAPGYRPLPPPGYMPGPMGPTPANPGVAPAPMPGSGPMPGPVPDNAPGPVDSRE